MADTEYSFVGRREESFLAFGFFFMNPIGFAIGCYILILLIIHLKNGEIKHKNIAYCAILAIFFQILLYFNDIFLSNNLIFEWNYDDNNFRWSTFTDILSTVFYGFSKILFYYTFTFHVLSIFTNNDNDKRSICFLKLWMICIGIIFIIIIIIVCIDDSTSNSPKETGLTSPHNIYVSMVSSHKEAQIAKYAMSLVVLLDIIYFLVLIIIYIKKLKYIQNNHKTGDLKYLQIGIKGVNLVIFACIIFWFFMICVITDTPLKWWGAIDITSDTLCLFLMFEFNHITYNYLCGKCHNCWTKLLYHNRSTIQLTETVKQNANTSTDTMNV